MTGGGPEKATYVAGLDIFTQAYVSIRFGYAMAEVWLLVAVILILSTYQVRMIRAGQIKLRRETV
jgi:ABC-type sugar transport system permease subunit